LLSLARRFWFDALIVVGIGISIAGAVLSQGKKDGPEGPMWLDIVLVLLIVGPLLARRRFPFGAPLGVGAGVVIASFADNRLVPFDIIAFLAGCSAVFLLAQRRDWRQAVPRLATARGGAGARTAAESRARGPARRADARGWTPCRAASRGGGDGAPGRSRSDCIPARARGPDECLEARSRDPRRSCRQLRRQPDRSDGVGRRCGRRQR